MPVTVLLYAIFIPFLIAVLILTVVALYYYFKIIMPLFDKVDNTKALIDTIKKKINPN